MTEIDNQVGAIVFCGLAGAGLQHIKVGWVNCFDQSNQCQQRIPDVIGGKMLHINVVTGQNVYTTHSVTIT